MSKLSSRADYEAVLDYILKVCNNAVAEAQPVTPVALTGHFGEHGFENLGCFDLHRMQTASAEKAAHFVRELSTSGRYDFVAYVSSGWVIEQDASEASKPQQRVPLERHPNRAEAVVTMIYTEDGQAFAHHLVDNKARCVIPGELSFIGDPTFKMNGDMVRPGPTLH